MNLLCLFGKHTPSPGYVRFKEPLTSGKFDGSHQVEHVQNCSSCGKPFYTVSTLVVEGHFNLVPRKEYDNTLTNEVKVLSEIGKTPKEISEYTGASLSTVRRRLKSVAD